MTSKGATIDVGAWLRGLGLGEYEATFRENAINEKVLPNLTAEDLKDMGVNIVGHRRMLLDAIALLRADGSATAPPAEASSTTPKPAQDTAERRQVTVLFADLVGSTALSARMDPEDLREVISAYQKCVAETVRRFGGFVAKYMGDGVLVYFGYPQAHEDDAERAVRAGLELVAAVNALKTSPLLQTRVGIATGLVVVGDLIGSGEAQERGIVGETPNLAARLQGIAEPNTVVIAESARKLLGNLFELKDLGALDLKGIGGRVRAWVALRPASVESRFEALHASGLTELVGREEELELLLRRWSRAKTGEGQVVLLSGEAGIGKSRLTAALLEAIASEPHTRLRYFCSPQHTDRALAQLATLPATPLLRREQIKLQVALITPLMHVKGYAASETKAATEQARLLMEQAEKLGEPLEDPFLLFSVLYGVWLANFVAFNGDVVRELARQFMTLAGKQRTIVPLMIGHRLMGTSLLFTGDVPEARAHYNKSITLYNPTEHRPQAARLGQEFGQDFSGGNLDL